MAATPRFAAAALEETIYMHKRGGGYTEPKLFLYHDQVREDTSKEMYLRHAGTKCDKKKKAMLQRGCREWLNTKARAFTIQPNRQCMEAIGRWIVEDGAAKNYFVTIRDCVYHLRNDAVTLKNKGVLPNETI